MFKLWIRKDSLSGYMIMMKGKIIYKPWISNFRPGNFVWIPSSGVSRIFIEELRQACHKHTNYEHVLVVTKLLCNE